jgi:perosamine synthetase
VTADCPTSRDNLIQALAEKSIGTAIYYPLPIHQQVWFQKLGTWPSFPVAEQLSREVLSIPVHPKLSQEDLTIVAESIQECCR